MLYSLFSGRAKTKALFLLYEHPREKFHMRQIERLTHERINSVRSALIALTKEGVCSKEAIGKKTFFQANQNYVFFDELLRIVAKNTGLGGRIVKEKLKLGKIKTAFLSLGFYRQLARTTEDIDLFIVGSVPVAEIAKVAKEEGDKRGVEINYSVMTPEEFVFRKKNKDPFLLSILQKGRLVLIGNEDIYSD
ncbi:MAG: hypothetical protein WC775_03980 [Patescibacteria group bacterium]|jgi:hypothetical protein